MMNCVRATRLMSESRERTLSFRERAAIKMHTLMCDGCNNFNVQVRDLGRIAHRYAKEQGSERPGESGITRQSRKPDL